MKHRLARLIVLAWAMLSGGCAVLQPRFSQNVAASFARQDMRKLVTPSLEVYYPARRRSTALRVAARLEKCVEQLRALPVTQRDRGRAVIFLTDSVFDNAYVQPLTVGLPQQMLLPDHMTLEIFNWFELGVSEIEDISCHESVHYVHLEQTDGFPRILNLITGGIWQPNVFTESWFLEGLATYYEGRLDKEVGRPHSMFWRGLFDSGAAALGGDVGAGMLSVEHRDALPFGGNYLVGQRFVDYLARTYGEAKLWEFIDEQGRSIASPMGVTLRFLSVYGKTLGAAFDDFRAELQAQARLRVRPPEQRVLQGDVGYLARLAGSPKDGALALVTVKRDDPTRLTVYEADGSVRFSRKLTEILPGRRYIEADPELTSGMSFSPDGQWLYLVGADDAQDASFESRLWRIDAHTGAVVRTWDGLDGFGGALSPQGDSYAFIAFEGDTANLVRLDLSTEKRTALTAFTDRESLGAPAWGPDGRIAFSRWMGQGWDLWTRETDGTLKQVTRGGSFNYAAQWLDANHVVALGAHEGRWQVQRLSLSTGESEWLTDAPFIALDPVVVGDRVAFLNRSGWSWSLDSVALPPDQRPHGELAAAEPGAPSAEVGRADEAEQPRVLADDAYSPLDHLLRPVLHLPLALIYPMVSSTNTVVWSGFASASLSGADRLGFHNYAANVVYFSQAQQLQISAGYGNYALAPWFTQLTAARLSDYQSRDLEASLSTSRTFWTSPVTLGFKALDRTTFDLGTPGTGGRIRLVGPSFDASYFAGEATAYGGTQRALGLSASGTYFPPSFGGTLTMADVRGEVDGYIPLPLLKRHSLRVSVAGRSLPGAPAGLMRVGGTPNGTLLTTSHSTQNPADQSPIDLPVDIAFTEPLRGYEDYAVRATNAGIAGIRYRIPWIIDRGTLSTLYLAPSFFLRQVDFEAFGAGAYTNSASGAFHRAAGAAVLVRMLFGQSLPLTLYAQYAYRFDDGLLPLFLTGVSFE